MLSSWLQGFWLICEIVRAVLSSNKKLEMNPQRDSTFIKLFSLWCLDFGGPRGLQILPTQVISLFSQQDVAL